MLTIKLDGKEYPMRYDLNALEDILERYGTFSAMLEESGTAGSIKFLTALLINEHKCYVGEAERITEDFVGARIEPKEAGDVLRKVLACIIGEKTNEKNA